MCQKYCFLAKIVPTYLQLRRTVIALPKKKSLLKVNTKCAAEAKELSDVNVGRYTLRETEIFTSLLYSGSLKSISILITVVLVQIQ